MPIIEARKLKKFYQHPEGGRIQVIAVDQALQQVTAGVERVDKARTVIGFLVRLLVALLGIGDVQLAAQILDVER